MVDVHLPIPSRDPPAGLRENREIRADVVGIVEPFAPWPQRTPVAPKLMDAHLDGLYGDIEAFLKGNPYTTRQYFDPKTFEHIYRVRWMWTQNSGYHAIRGVPVEAQAIIEDAQPYHRKHLFDGYRLWVLRRPSNVDKHETLPEPKFWTGPFEDGAVVARLPRPQPDTPGQGEANVKLGLAYDVAFAKGGPAGEASARIEVVARHEPQRTAAAPRTTRAPEEESPGALAYGRRAQRRPERPEPS